MVLAESLMGLEAARSISQTKTDEDSNTRKGGYSNETADEETFWH